jgi:hypothetical protein
MFLHDAKHRVSQEMLSCDIAFHADGIYDANENAFFRSEGELRQLGRKDSITGCVGVIVWHSHLQRLLAPRRLPNMSSKRWKEIVLAHASSPSRQLGLWHCQDLPGLQRSQPRISLGTKAPSLRIPCLQLPTPVDQSGLAPCSHGHSRGGSGCGWFSPAAKRTGSDARIP